MSRLTALPVKVPQDSGSLLLFQGPAFVAVEWALFGSGTLTPQSTYTNESGVAYAVYSPGSPGDAVTISVTHGT